MYMNSTLQLNPLVRVVAMLILGIALGDVLADVVGVRIWLGIFVVAVAAAFVAYNTNVRPMVQSLTPIRDKIAISCMLRQIHEFSSHAIRHGLYIKNQKRFFVLRTM